MATALSAEHLQGVTWLAARTAAVPQTREHVRIQRLLCGVVWVQNARPASCTLDAMQTVVLASRAVGGWSSGPHNKYRLQRPNNNWKIGQAQNFMSVRVGNNDQRTSLMARSADEQRCFPDSGRRLAGNAPLALIHDLSVGCSAGEVAEDRRRVAPLVSCIHPLRENANAAAV